MEYPTQVIVASTAWETDPIKNQTKLVVTDNKGLKYYINDKRQNLWPVFDGFTGPVNIIWKMPPPNATWKAFIEGATRGALNTAPSPTMPLQPVSHPPIQTNTPVQQQPSVSVSMPPAHIVQPISRDDSIWAQVAYKGLIELDAVGKLEPGLHIALVAFSLDKVGIKFEVKEPAKAETPQPIKVVKKA